MTEYVLHLEDADARAIARLLRTAHEECGTGCVCARVADEIEAQTPAPRPTEPTGLGAVVRASAYTADFRYFVRIAADQNAPWIDANGNGHDWGELDTISRVLSEGVHS